MDEKCNKMLFLFVFSYMDQKEEACFSLEVLKNKEQLKVLLNFLPHFSKKVLLRLKLAIRRPGGLLFTAAGGLKKCVCVSVCLCVCVCMCRRGSFAGQLKKKKKKKKKKKVWMGKEGAWVEEGMLDGLHCLLALQYWCCVGHIIGLPVGESEPGCLCQFASRQAE